MKLNKVVFATLGGLPRYYYGIRFPTHGRKKGDAFYNTEEGKLYEFNGRKFIKID